MSKNQDMFAARKSLDEICIVPDKIISVYSLEKHVWADSNSKTARLKRLPELQTIEEFQIDPVRPFLNDILRNLAAPYKPERRDISIGQGYWIQAEFGSGKSHLLCFLATLSLGNKEAWQLIREKEQKAGRGKRESIFRFWEEGLEAKSTQSKGIFVVVKTLVGAGGGTIGLTNQGQRLSEYILDAVKEQVQCELGKNLSLYPTELLADRFLSKDLDRYRADLKKFLRDSKFFETDEFEDINDFVRDIQQDKTPEYKRSCGNKLWRFYTEYLEMQPQIAAETEDILKHMVEVILAEGYSGVVLILDELSLFMKNRDEDLRTDDEKTLVVLANRLAKVHNLPIWTVCSAQQAIESKMGVKNIIADDRLKLVKLLEEDKDYYDIVLARVREIKAPNEIGYYYLHYKRGFTWPNSIGEKEFTHFFPFHKPALEVLKAITYELTTARSAIHFMHQTLKYQVKHQGRELIRLWELFDEAVRYEEDPSGVHAGLVAIKTKRESEYRAYEAARRQIDSLTKGPLKIHRDKAIKTIQTLFLYYLAKTRQQGLTGEGIANSVLIERDAEANPDENIQHYETLAENLKRELRQIALTLVEDNRSRYRFEPVVTGIDPREEFRKARDEAETNEFLVQEAWENLLDLGEWLVRTRQMTMDLSHGGRSLFQGIINTNQSLEITWQGRQVNGLIGMWDLGKIVSQNHPLPAIDSDETDRDFAVFIGKRPISTETLDKLLSRFSDPRIIFWSPAELKPEERDRLLDFTAFRKLVSVWQGKETEDALAVINWVFNSLETELGRIIKIVDSSFSRGRIDVQNNRQLDFHVAGELPNIIAPVVDRVLASIYESREIKFAPPFVFRKEEGVKVINGIVKIGNIPPGVKPNQNISAAQNFGFGLKIIKKSAEKVLDVSDNPYVKDMWTFINNKLADEGQSMKIETLYKNFMGIGGPKDYGLSRRMVQIFLLCLVQQGKIRIGLSAKSGLNSPYIDYANLAEIDFSAKILDALTEVQKMARPESWEVLRPYAEKILAEEIPVTHDDAIISLYRTKLREKFRLEKEESSQTQTRAFSLFEILKSTNPYSLELDQAIKLFHTDIEGPNDIASLLHALKEIYGYQAFNTNSADQGEVDDLTNRLQNYHDLKKFLKYDQEIRTIQAYCKHFLPEIPDLLKVRTIQQKIVVKMTALQSYIDSEVKLKTELIGRVPPVPGDTGTLGALTHEYKPIYILLHDQTLGEAEDCRKEIHDLLKEQELKALKILEQIKALQPPVSATLETELKNLANNIFTCPIPARNSIEDQLLNTPVHECGLSFENEDKHLKDAHAARDKAKLLFDNAINRKLELFLTPGIRARLEKGKSEAVIAKLLACAAIGDLRGFLMPECLANPDLVDIINRYLKRIVIKPVPLSNFQPTIGMVEKEQVTVLAEEFRQFLEEQLGSIDSDDDILPMLQLE